MAISAESTGEPEHLTPLMVAAARGDTESVRRLLDDGASVNVLDDSIGTTALHLAAQNGSVDVARLLVERGAHVNLQAPSDGFTADGRLTAAEQLDAVRSEITAGADVDAVSPVMNSGHDAHTPILAAALLGHAEIVRELRDAGADVTIGCGHMKANPAHKAASFGHTDVMRALAAHPSFPAIRDARGPYNGYTPLMDAVWHGHVDAARVLLEAGADPDVRGHDGKTALDLAREFGYASIEDLLTSRDVGLTADREAGSHRRSTEAAE